MLCFQLAAGKQKFEALIVAAVYGSFLIYTFLESVLYFQPAAGEKKIGNSNSGRSMRSQFDIHFLIRIMFQPAADEKNNLRP